MEEEKNAVCRFFCPILVGAPPAVLLVPFQKVHLMCPVPAVKEVIPANENPALEAAPSSQLDTLGSVHTAVGCPVSGTPDPFADRWEPID